MVKSATHRSVVTSVDFVWCFALKKMTHSFAAMTRNIIQ